MVEPENGEKRSARQDARATFEEFTSGAAWRALPLKIKLVILRLWRAERDIPPK